jgi:ribosomal protein L6P/L9E
VDFPIPEGITVEVERHPGHAQGVDKHLVGMTHRAHPRHPQDGAVQGAGHQVRDEKVRRKVGKQGAV